MFSAPGTTKQTKAPQLPPVGNTSAPAQPKTSPVKTDTPGQNLEFAKQKQDHSHINQAPKHLQLLPLQHLIGTSPSRQMEPPAANN